MMLEEEVKLYRFAGISPEQSFTEAGRHREAVVAADQSMVIGCFGDDLSVFVDDDFHALPPVQRPSAQPRCCEIYLTSHRPRRSNAEGRGFRIAVRPIARPVICTQMSAQARVPSP